MAAFEHAEWCWEPLEHASEKPAADFLLAGGFSSPESRNTDELRRNARGKAENGEALGVLVSRNGRAECFMGFDWNTEFVYMGIWFRDEPAAELLEALAAIGAYVRDRTERVMVLDPERPETAELSRFFRDAYETGYAHVISDEQKKRTHAPGPPAIVLKGECSAQALTPAAERSLDSMLAAYKFAGFES
jgi:hypothetical protein